MRSASLQAPRLYATQFARILLCCAAHMATIVLSAAGPSLGFNCTPIANTDVRGDVPAADDPVGTCIDPPCLVVPGLYIGSAEAERCKHALSSIGITHILQVGGELACSHDAHFTYKRLAVSDEEKEDLVSTFREAFPFIDAGRQAGGVLVHCAQGMSRSGTVVVGYLMWKNKQPVEAALAQVQRCRPVVEPNPGFMLQLQDFGRSNCALEEWAGWDEEQLRRSFRRSSVSGRRVVHHFSEVIRKFHVHSLTEEDTVFQEEDTVLAL